MDRPIRLVRENQSRVNQTWPCSAIHPGHEHGCPHSGQFTFRFATRGVSLWSMQHWQAQNSTLCAVDDV
jgi:hypothetical protein